MCRLHGPSIYVIWHSQRAYIEDCFGRSHLADDLGGVLMMRKGSHCLQAVRESGMAVEAQLEPSVLTSAAGEDSMSSGSLDVTASGGDSSSDEGPPLPPPAQYEVGDPFSALHAHAGHNDIIPLCTCDTARFATAT